MFTEFIPLLDLDLFHSKVKFGQMLIVLIPDQWSGERLQDHWSSGSLVAMSTYILY